MLHAKLTLKTYFVQFVAGHTWEELFPCIQWMKCFADITLEKGVITLRSFEHVSREDSHNIQTHAVELASLVSDAFPFIGVRHLSSSSDKNT